ncbi:MAG: BamA/TamA family outer membrane protein [candidate division Zixibacteria bacterium]|nr:BamA/TamA family outer membrane protein [candidate division Zixibacteria bacterium]
MKIILKTTILLLIALISLIRVADSEEILFNGNKAFSSIELHKIINSSMPATSPDSLSTVIDIITETYHSAGYWNCKVSQNRLDGSTLNKARKIIVNEGERFIFGDIVLDNLNNFQSEYLKSQVGKIKNRIATKVILESYIAELLRFYSDNGRPYVFINAEDFIVDYEKKEVDVVLNVNEGPAVKIDTLVIRGIKTTCDYVIRREIQYLLGDGFDQRKLESAIERISRLGFVSVVESPGLYFDGIPSEGVLVFNIKENRNSIISGVFGYVPPESSQKEYITGLLEISLANIMGTGRKARIFYSSPDPESKLINFSYTEPYFAGTPIDWTIGFNQIDRDSTYVNISAEVSLRYRAGLRTDLNLTLNSERTTPGNSALFPEERFTGYSARVGVSGSYYDYNDNPRKGNSINLGVKYIKRMYQNYESYVPEKPEINRTAADFNGSVVFPVRNSSVISLSAGAAGITSDNSYLPISERFNIGGRKTVRGYLEGRFYGSHIAYLRNEYRFLSGRDGRIFLFMDNGYYYYKTRQDTIEEKLISGFGFGITSKIRIGLITVEFAWGEGDSFGDGKFHFGIENRF